MGGIGVFTPEKLVIPVLTTRINRVPELKEALELRFGPVDYQSAELPFEYTKYYIPEMGDNIKRLFFSFEKLVDPQTLAEIKIETNSLEDLLAEDGKRKINLDPGLLALSRFVLATTKENAHRIPLSKGIYAEITLLYSGGDFHALPWTYPDYAAPEYREILRDIRALLAGQLKLLKR